MVLYIERWLQAPVEQENGQLVPRQKGTPQGGVISPLLANLFLHLPADFTLLQIEGPDVAVSTRDPAELPTDWTTNLGATREIGDKWLFRGSSVLLKVPSVIVPRTFNLLFNPLHRQAKGFDIRQAYVYPFDGRIKQ